jgi:hypothetical protein
MASSQKIATNRRNAQCSTGPRTANGKGRARLNAFRHGLAAQLLATGAVDRDVERLASAIAGPNPDSCRLHFASIAAEAEFELRRVRARRRSLLALATSAGSTSPEPEREMLNPATACLNLPRLDRYEQCALSRPQPCASTPIGSVRLNAARSPGQRSV